MKFSIECTELGGTRSPKYDSLEQAREALRHALGWVEIYLSPGYTTADGANQIWCAYPTLTEGDANAAFETTPRIRRVIDPP